ncbi:MAG: NADH-quinone oxidoreductase subunit I [Planctomycetes bacterium]|nr:NADH-quinone oxidoreductase subunit I [Planctomycetota bacterium]
MAKLVPRPELTFWERIYFVEIFKGLATTFGHARRTLTNPAASITLMYPEVQPDIPRDYRARHRLMKRPDASPRCVACYMCSTACPARCINIVAEESPDHHIEKRPAKFEIDLLLCVFCGFCVEACPCDAIRMDTKQAILAGDNRADFVVDKAKLMDWDPKDYPDTDVQSQKAPGGKLHAQALEEFKSGTYH